MGFKFNLESVLKYRRRLENEAQRQYREAQAKVDEANSKLDLLYRSIDRSRADISKFQSTSKPQALEHIRSQETFILGQGVRIKNQRLELRNLLTELEEKQEALVLALRERKSMEKLKERRKEEYLKEQLRLENQAMDEISVLRHGRKV